MRHREIVFHHQIELCLCIRHIEFPGVINSRNGLQRNETALGILALVIHDLRVRGKQYLNLLVVKEPG